MPRARRARWTPRRRPPPPPPTSLGRRQRCRGPSPPPARPDLERAGSAAAHDADLEQAALDGGGGAAASRFFAERDAAGAAGGRQSPAHHVHVLARGGVVDLLVEVTLRVVEVAAFGAMLYRASPRLVAFCLAYCAAH